jgi:uncharacterized membrane protein YphA (DoxX/SURF4 family)
MRLLGGVNVRSWTPTWVATILKWPWLWVTARTVMTSAYLFGGLVKLADFHAAVAEQEHFGLYPGWLWAGAAIVVELGGSILVISGRLLWLGAGAIGVLTGIATVVASDFWRLDGHARLMAANTFCEHVGLVAGFVVAAIMAERLPAAMHEQVNNKP